jgi:hypothetical protein
MRETSGAWMRSTSAPSRDTRMYAPLQTVFQCGRKSNGDFIAGTLVPRAIPRL